MYKTTSLIEIKRPRFHRTRLCIAVADLDLDYRSIVSLEDLVVYTSAKYLYT